MGGLTLRKLSCRSRAGDGDSRPASADPVDESWHEAQGHHRRRPGATPFDRSSPATVPHQETRALQEDDFDNPGFLAVERGAELWRRSRGRGQVLCELPPRPRDDEGRRRRDAEMGRRLKKPVNLEQRINMCRSDQMGAEPWKFDPAS